MLSIGALSRRTGVKPTTIRWYEDEGLLPPAERTEGGQRRWPAAAVDRLAFIRHGRALGFPLPAVRELLELSDHPDRPCAEAGRIAQGQLAEVRARLARLRRLEAELERIAARCDGDGPAGECGVLEALGDHGLCETEH